MYDIYYNVCIKLKRTLKNHKILYFYNTVRSMKVQYIHVYTNVHVPTMVSIQTLQLVEFISLMPTKWIKCYNFLQRDVVALRINTTSFVYKVHVTINYYFI